MVYDEDKQAVKDLGIKVLSGNEVLSFEHRIIHKNGSIRWVRNTPVLHYNDRGVLISYDGLISNITERKIAEEKVQQTIMQLNGIFQALPDLYFRMESDGTIIDYKAGPTTELYVPPEVFLGKKAQSVLPHTVGQKFANAINEISLGKSQVVMEYLLH